MPFIAFRRGYWWYDYVRGLLPAALFPVACKVLKRCTSTSSMSCMISFSHAVLAAVLAGGCSECTQRGAHTHRIHMRAMPGGVVHRIDGDPFDDHPEAWTVYQLNHIGDADAKRVWRTVQDARFNQTGFTLNFLPRWMRLPFCGGPTGMQKGERLEDQDAFFCSELACAFVQNFGMCADMVPCETSPQMLHRELLLKHVDRITPVDSKRLSVSRV